MNRERSAIDEVPPIPLDPPPNRAHSDRSDESKTIADEPESVDVATLVGPSSVPAPLHDPMQKTVSGEVDWTRLDALVRAVEALVGANMAAEARPLIAQLKAVIDEARGPTAQVIDFNFRRER